MSSNRIRDRFPPPWRIEQTPGGYRVVASNDVLIAYVYARDDLAHHTRRDYLTSAEARAVAKAIAGLAVMSTPGGESPA